MPFKEKYQITKQYLPNSTKRRPGLLISPSVKFIVAHDTGNAGSTAKNNVSYFANTANESYASAHIFVDDKDIIECIPAFQPTQAEKAWHVRYEKQEDNILFGCNANDAAIGVEYCYGSNINSDESYKRYIWIIAYLCHIYKLSPATSITGLFLLDPGRKTDPISGLNASNRTYDQLLSDVVKEYNLCINTFIMKLIQNTSSKKVYAIGNDNKKHWIFNEETFNTGVAMGLWGNWDTIETQNDDGYAEGHAIIFIK